MAAGVDVVGFDDVGFYFCDMDEGGTVGDKGAIVGEFFTSDVAAGGEDAEEFFAGDVVEIIAATGGRDVGEGAKAHARDDATDVGKEGFGARLDKYEKVLSVVEEDGGFDRGAGGDGAKDRFRDRGLKVEEGAKLLFKLGVEASVVSHLA